MPDLPLVAEYREALSSSVAQLQWWASVSFGLIALAHFGRKHLTLMVAICLSAAYFMFTLFAFVNAAFLGRIMAGAQTELSALRDSKNISAVGLALLKIDESGGRLNGILMIVCMVVTFLGTLTFLWYAYRKQSHA
jgi:hypothetical protein